MRKASLFWRILVFPFIFAVFGLQAQPYTVVSPEAQVQEGLRRQEERLRSQQDAVTPKLDVLKPGDDLVVGEEPFLLALRDELLELFYLRESDVDGEHEPRLSS